MNHRLNVIGAAMGLAALGFANSAWALHFAPAGTAFMGGGNATVIGPTGASLTCSARYKLKTKINGVSAKITSALFFGAGGCTSAVAQGLPWKILPTSLSTVNILGVSVTSPLGACGPGTVPATLSASVMTFNTPLAGGCTVSGNINITPTLTITP